MLSFVGGICLLIAGYFTYGKFVEKVLAPDDRETPAVAKYDGVDFMVLPGWKAMLIQLLNIAGIGPVIGVILGIRFGTIVFWIIPVGNLIGGAVHDLVSGMISIRCGGANLTEIVRRTCGRIVYGIFSAFTCFLLLLVVAVFVNVPASIIDKGFFPENPIFWLAVVLIFLYYIAATFFPIDKIIGRFYPVFGAILILGSVAIFIKLIMEACGDPALLQESEAFKAAKFTAANDHPVIPLLFVTIACGIISGFHATQIPIVARTLKSEYLARPAFYGMMVLEGIIAMIWAGAGLAIYNLFPKYMQQDPTVVLTRVTDHFLGSWVGGVTLISVVVLAITSGDTAMRSLRLSLAEMFHVSQVKIMQRMVLCIPVIAAVMFLLYWSNTDADAFRKLWNYFAWGNQVLSAVTLCSCTIYLVSLKKPAVITVVPALFMTFIVTCFICWTSAERKGPAGLGIDLEISCYIGAAVALAAVAGAYRQGMKKRRLNDPDWIGKE